MEVELRKSEVPALAELKDLCRHECTAERCADAVREFGWSLEHVPEDMKTPEMCRRALAAKAVEVSGASALLSDRVKPGLKTPELWRKCAEHSWMSFVMIPWRERSPEACLTAYLNYPGMIHAHPHVVPQPVDSYCNVYSLCRLMEQMTGGKFTYGQMADFYGGKPMAVKCIEVPDGFLKDREVTFDRQKETFRIAPLSQRQEQKERQEPERNDAPKRRNGMKI